MDNVPVLLEHVHLLDGGDGLDIELLEGGLQLLVVASGGLVDLLDLSPGGAFAAVRWRVSSALWLLVMKPNGFPKVGRGG